MAFDVAVVVRDAPQVEEAHEVLVLAVYVPEDLDWRVNSQHHRLLLQDALALLCECDDVFTSECKVPVAVILCSPFTWAQQVVQEQVV